MKMVKEIPTCEQFVAVWVYKGEIWSHTIKRDRGSLYTYCEETDSFDTNIFDAWLAEMGAVYITQEEG